MKRKAEVQMSGTTRQVFQPVFSTAENEALQRIAKLADQMKISQICFTVPVDPEGFVTCFPASFLYFVEHYNVYGIMRIRGLGPSANHLTNTWIEDMSSVSDMDKMSPLQLASTLSLGEIDPYLYCRGDAAGILAFFELVTEKLEQDIAASAKRAIEEDKKRAEEERILNIFFQSGWGKLVKQLSTCKKQDIMSTPLHNWELSISSCTYGSIVCYIVGQPIRLCFRLDQDENILHWGFSLSQPERNLVFADSGLMTNDYDKNRWIGKRIDRHAIAWDKLCLTWSIGGMTESGNTWFAEVKLPDCKHETLLDYFMRLNNEMEHWVFCDKCLHATCCEDPISKQKIEAVLIYNQIHECMRCKSTRGCCKPALAAGCHGPIERQRLVDDGYYSRNCWEHVGF